MKTADDIQTELNDLVQAHYYEEDYTLQWAVKNYHDALASEEQDTFEQVMVNRLIEDPSIVNITLCARLEMPAAVPILTKMLNEENSDAQRVRGLMTALSAVHEDAVYRAMERYMDSEHEHQVLLHLARIDFNRARRHLMRAMRQSFADPCLHAFYERKKAVGLDRLVHDLKAWAQGDPQAFRTHLENVLSAKQPPYNPFSPQERDYILASVTG